MFDAAPVSAPLVGPNAVIQTGVALLAIAGRARAEAVFARARRPEWLDAPPAGMVSQTEAAALFDALRVELPDDWPAVAALAGRLTAAYLLAVRIPPLARLLLRVTPPPLAARLLTAAVARHAWTFAGGGAFAATPGAPTVLVIRDNPLAQPGCPWHLAVFELLFRRLVARDAVVTHPRCCGHGAEACVFHVALHGGRKARP